MSTPTVSARSDIFSFGAVLYDMATRRCAFTGDSAATVIAEILRGQRLWRQRRRSYGHAPVSVPTHVEALRRLGERHLHLLLINSAG
jgi:hypothetical protein